MRVLLFTLVVLSLMSWVGATPYPDSGLRQTMLHWEKSRTSGSPQDRLLKELTMIMSTEADGTKLELLDKYKKRHSGTLYAVWAEYLLLSERAPSNSVRLERLKELARQAGGPSLEEAFATTRPLELPLVGRAPRAHQNTLLLELYGDLTRYGSRAGRHDQTARLYRYLRIQFGDEVEDHRRPLEELFDARRADLAPPEILPLYPRPNTVNYDDGVISFQLQDQGKTPSHCDLRTLKVSLDGRDVTPDLERNHFIGLTEREDAPQERIEVRIVCDPPLQPGRHRVVAEVVDHWNNPTAMSWQVFVFRNNTSAEFQGLLLNGRDEQLADWFRANPEFVWLRARNKFDRLSDCLRIAAARGLSLTTKELLSQGFPANLQYRWGGTGPTWEAIRSGNLEVLEAVLAAGAQLKDEPGGTLWYACRFHNADVVDFLLKRGLSPLGSAKEGETLLHIYANSRAEDILRRLVREFPDLDVKNDKGVSPAQVAATRRNVKTLRILVEAGADRNQRDAQGRSLLQRAGDDSAPEGIKELLEP